MSLAGSELRGGLDRQSAATADVSDLEAFPTGLNEEREGPAATRLAIEILAFGSLGQLLECAVKLAFDSWPLLGVFGLAAAQKLRLV